jgi:hypothetical protein
MGGTSRMTGDGHVRICERPGVQFPRPTRLSILGVRGNVCVGPVKVGCHPERYGGLEGANFVDLEAIVRGEDS